MAFRAWVFVVRAAAGLAGDGEAEVSEAASERRAMIGCTFVAGCILFAPGEFRSGGFLMLVSLGLLLRHQRLSARELAAAAPQPPPAP